MVVQLWLMPLTVFDVKGMPRLSPRAIEAAVVAGGKLKHTEVVSEPRLRPHETWIAADVFKGGVKVLITNR